MKLAASRLALGCLVLSSAPQLAAAEPPAAAQPPAQPAPLVVSGDLPRGGAVTLAELQALAPVTARWTYHGQSHSVVGVPLEKVLARFGYEPGPTGKALRPRDKRPGYKLAVLASAPDGFQAVFSAAELTAGMGTTQALVVWQVDGQALPPAQGPLRLVVPTDGEPSRSLFQLRRLEVLDLRRAARPAP